MTKTILPTRSALSAELAELNIEKILAEAALDCLLGEAAEADREQRAFDNSRTPAESIHPLSDYIVPGVPGVVRTGGVVRYHTAPAPEVIEAAKVRAEEARLRLATCEARLRELPADPDPIAECRRTGSRYYAGRRFAFGDSTFEAGQVVPDAELAEVDGRRLAALLKAGTLKDGAPFRSLEVGR